MNLQEVALRHLIPHRTAFETVRRDGYMITEEGSGLMLRDQDGLEYLDMMSSGPRAAAVGYGRKEIAQSMYEQAARMHFYTPDGGASEVTIRLAQKLAQICPGDLNRVFFVSGGSEAVESAFKLARQHHIARGYKRKFKIISRRGAFHGATVGAASATGSMSPMRELMEPVAPGYIFIPAPTCYRCPFRKSYGDCDIDCALFLEDTIKFESPELVSAFIMEPVMQFNGCQVAPREYFETVRSICDRYNVLLIFDEIITGFGRTGKMFAADHYGVVPDIMTVAKGFTSGYAPLGAAIARESVIAPLPMFFHIHTFGGHPVGCAAALANINIIEQEHLVHNAYKMGEYLFEGLKKLQNYPIVGDVRGIGLWAAVEFVKNKETKEPFCAPDEISSRVVRYAKKEGILFGMINHSVEMAPALCITAEQVDTALSVLSRAISRVSDEA